MMYVPRATGAVSSDGIVGRVIGWSLNAPWRMRAFVADGSRHQQERRERPVRGEDRGAARRLAIDRAR